MSDNTKPSRLASSTSATEPGSGEFWLYQTKIRKPVFRCGGSMVRLWLTPKTAFRSLSEKCSYHQRAYQQYFCRRRIEH